MTIEKTSLVTFTNWNDSTSKTMPGAMPEPKFNTIIANASEEKPSKAECRQMQAEVLQHAYRVGVSLQGHRKNPFPSVETREKMLNQLRSLIRALNILINQCKGVLPEDEIIALENLEKQARKDLDSVVMHFGSNLREALGKGVEGVFNIIGNITQGLQRRTN